MAPVSRLFSKLGYPKLNYDPVLYQELLILYRKLYTADGQRTAALLAAKQAAAPASSASAAKGGAVGAGDGSSDASSGDHSSDADQPFGTRKRRQSSRTSMAAHLQQGQRSNAPPTYGAVQPQLTSQQELVLFMRWLNTTYDAMNKIQQVKDSSSGSAQAPAEGAAKGTGFVFCSSCEFVCCDVGCVAHYASARSEYQALQCGFIRVSCVVLGVSQANKVAPAKQRAPQFPVTQGDRQGVMEAVSRLLRPVMPQRSGKEFVEVVRLVEYELLMAADCLKTYANRSLLGGRVIGVCAGHPEWRVPAMQVDSRGLLVRAANSSSSAAVVDLTGDDVDTGNSSSASGVTATAGTADHSQWRCGITEEIRQLMIYRVEKMLRLVSSQLNINSAVEMNHKIQQYEMGLVISANSLEEYMDKATLPRRLASLVTDFSEYKKGLTLQDMLK
jgi:hypothetical protein